MHYAHRHIADHLSEAEPSADLRDALLNTNYITSLIANQTPWEIGYLLADFLSFLKGSVSPLLRN